MSASTGGGHLLIDRTLRRLKPGEALVVTGGDAHLELHLRALARSRGHRVDGKVQALQADMDEGRRRRLVRLGFTGAEASELSALHTKNMM